MEISRVEVFDSHIRIEYTDGSSEEVEQGVYERKDTEGDTVEQRAATGADVARLSGLAADFEAAPPHRTARSSRSR